MTNKIHDQLGKFILSRLRQTGLRKQNLKQIHEMATSSYLGDYISVCRVLGRFYCYVDTRDRTLGIQLLLKGFWEIQNTECIARLVSKGMNVVDVGANFGYYTLLLGGLVGNGGGKVYSVEANPKIFKLLYDTLNINGFLSKTIPLNYAIYKEKSENLEFTYGNQSTMNGRLNECKINPDKYGEEEVRINVKGDTLDNLIPQGEQIGFIKVDIEGAEEMFWHGSKRIRKENPGLKILMEFNSRRYKNAEQFVSSIYEEGFKVKLIGKSEEHDKYLLKDQLMNIPTHTHVMLLLEK